MKSANARIEAFYTFDGGEVRTRLTSNEPLELLNQLYKAMDEWTATVRQQPKAFSVTLAPYVIALGPAPPNIADFEHQRDVLIRCAKLRSQTLDKLNLIDYMLDPDHMDEFEIVTPPDGPDLAALQAALAGDLDVIADAASFAIDNIKRACDPVTFMRTIGGVADFELTPLPANLPKHTGGTSPGALPVRLPNLVGVQFHQLAAVLVCLQHGGTVDGCLDGTAFPGQDGEIVPVPLDRDVAKFLDMATNGTLNVTWIPGDPGDLIAGAPGPTDFSVQSQSPPAGTEVPRGSEVVVRILAVPE